MRIDDQTEWLEADGLGGFASGTTAGIRTRRYHALLLTATTPPTGRMVLVNGFDAWVDTTAGSFALSTQRYAPDVLHPDGASHIEDFTHDPWPTWEFDVADGTARAPGDLGSARHGRGRHRLDAGQRRGSRRASRQAVPVRPRLPLDASRERRRSASTRTASEATVRFSSYDGVPDVVSLSNGDYRHAPEWYRRFLYTAERERGLDDTEDLASPGELSWPLSAPANKPCGCCGPQLPMLTQRAHRRRSRHVRRRCETRGASPARAFSDRPRSGGGRVSRPPRRRQDDRRRLSLVHRLGPRHVHRHPRAVPGDGPPRRRARHPGRMGRRRVGRDAAESDFPITARRPSSTPSTPRCGTSSRSTSCCSAARSGARLLTSAQRQRARAAVTQIVSGYARGTRFGIRMDADGLLAAGVPGVQLTWMDARVGGSGHHAAHRQAGRDPGAVAERAAASRPSSSRDWRDVVRATADARSASGSGTRNCGQLADVVDVDHVPGTRDDACRPNQILAVGGLPIALARRCTRSPSRRRRRAAPVDADRPAIAGAGRAGLRAALRGRLVGARRRLSPGHGVAVADRPVRRGVGPRARAIPTTVRREARQRFLAPLLAHLRRRRASATCPRSPTPTPPFAPRGCPFQAWSLGELLRLDRVVLAEPKRAPRRRKAESRVA